LEGLEADDGDEDEDEDTSDLSDIVDYMDITNAVDLETNDIPTEVIKSIAGLLLETSFLARTELALISFRISRYALPTLNFNAR
jgi:hypothetical protein